ncbi:MAG TPA: tyrosine-type recombinase/integrase [Microthrixaceae bacterium]|jgi:site-specific recombinase XerD|nr:tyrosine-type recombinase/integrase [Microthrixaceae bacterium]
MAGTRRRPGRMGPFIESYRGELLRLGYTPMTVRGLLQHVGALGRWMADNDVEPADLDVAVLEEFLEHRRAEGRAQVRTTRSMLSLLDHLRVLGVVSPAEPMPVDPLLVEYRAWMVDDRGLAPLTVLRYENLAVRFLERVGDRPLGSVGGRDVSAFLLAETARVSVGSAKGRVAEMRSLLRFLFLTGRTEHALAGSVPPVAGWHDTGVPRGAKAPDVARLLAACDPATLTGSRDLAVLTMVARLGLRSVEVARLELDDIDWRSGEFTVRGKARRVDRLPLVTDVGETLAGWLQRRPAIESRRVFVTTKAPIRDIRPALVSEALRRVCVRCGVEVIGAHRLRHGLATDLLQHGASLVEVGQVLRHRDLATTAVYAKVDIDNLRRLAQPWPGAPA